MTTPTTRKTRTKPKTKTPSLTLSMTEAEKMIEECIYDEIRTNWTEERIREKVNNLIASKFEKIVALQLGFADKWNTWEVDRSNGRAGHTLIGAKIAQMAAESVDTIIAKRCAEGGFILTPAHIKALEKEFTQTVTGYEAKKVVQQLAMTKIKRLTDLLEGKLTGATD